MAIPLIILALIGVAAISGGWAIFTIVKPDIASDLVSTPAQIADNRAKEAMAAAIASGSEAANQLMISQIFRWVAIIAVGVLVLIVVSKIFRS